MKSDLVKQTKKKKKSKILKYFMIPSLYTGEFTAIPVYLLDATVCTLYFLLIN